MPSQDRFTTLANACHGVDRTVQMTEETSPNAVTGRGCPTEAGQATLDFALGPLLADDIIATAHPDNIALHKVMIRLGMTFRGTETRYDMPSTTYAPHNPKVFSLRR